MTLVSEPDEHIRELLARLENALAEAKAARCWEQRAELIDCEVHLAIMESKLARVGVIKEAP